MNQNKLCIHSGFWRYWESFNLLLIKNQPRIKKSSKQGRYSTWDWGSGSPLSMMITWQIQLRLASNCPWVVPPKLRLMPHIISDRHVPVHLMQLERIFQGNWIMCLKSGEEGKSWSYTVTVARETSATYWFKSLCFANKCFLFLSCHQLWQRGYLESQ